MNEELEALNVLYGIALNCNYHYQKEGKETDDYKERIEFHKNIVKTALEELEVKREVIGDILTGDDEKKLQAFEYIRAILFGRLELFETTEKIDGASISIGNYYVIEFRLRNEKERLYIPKEVYDLLKEVLPYNIKKGE